MSLGANLGDRSRTLNAAIASLEQVDGIHVLAHSRWSETTPAGGPPHQADFLNGAARLETTLSPTALLDQLHQVENALGRRREVRWGARSIDLDLLLYDDVIVATPQLTVPHPRLAFRRFVLAPCLEIAPEWVHPLIGWSLEECFEHLQKTPRSIAVACCSAESANTVARLGAQQAGAFFIADPAVAGNWRDAENDLASAPRRATALADAAVEQTEWVSGFWLEPPFAAAPRPTFVVWLDEPFSDGNPSTPPEDTSVSGVDSSAPLRKYNRDLGRRVMQRGRGPWLQLPTADLTQAANEVAAALLAMRPQ